MFFDLAGVVAALLDLCIGLYAEVASPAQS